MDNSGYRVTWCLMRYQGPLECKESFLNGMWFSAADGLALLQDPQSLPCDSPTGACHKFSWLFCLSQILYYPIGFPGMYGPCNRANYTAACTCYCAFTCSGSHWKLSPSIWIGSIPKFWIPKKKPTKLGVLPWWKNNIDKVSGWDAKICFLLWRRYLGIQADRCTLKISEPMSIFFHHWTLRATHTCTHVCVYVYVSMCIYITLNEFIHVLPTQSLRQEGNPATPDVYISDLSSLLFLSCFPSHVG